MPGPTEPDSPLKAALKRVGDRHAAPPELRASIAAKLQAALSEQTPPPARRWQISRRTAVGLAACVALWAGAGVYYYETRETPEQRYLAENKVLFDAMVRTAAAEPGKVAAAAATQPAGDVRAAIARQLGHAVPTPDLSAAGWKLTAASVVRVAGNAAGRFDFARDGHRVTLLSLAADRLFGATDGSTYSLVSDGHPLAGYVLNHGLNCVVGETGMPLADAAALNERLRCQ